jgi:DNA-binding SARP family transcriptional activator/tetratricopeptide (TPR) repeat protein
VEETALVARVEAEEPVDRAFERAPRPFPLRPAKIQCPRLPEETLHRERLLGWIGSKVDHRVIFVVAEAGFGKTTLLADFARRSHARTLWYRLDEEDTDGLVFLRYLVSACQAVDPRLAPRSASLLVESASGPASSTEILETLLAELDASADVPSVLILDDYHTVEGNESIREVVERLIARAPDRMTFILASRRTPDLAAGALRARDELAELDRDDLRFDRSETDRLFRDAYRQPLESDVLADLQARTEGWVASLQLVRTATGGRTSSQVRSFVNSLSGSEGGLYEYLAEEVVGELDPALRDFLIRVSVLEDAEPDTAGVAAGLPAAPARQLLGQAQRLGLLARGGDGQTWRAHPLVREYLLARLVAEIGEEGVAELHRQLATLLEPRSWRLAARHWAAAGDPDQVRRVIGDATPTIIGTGDLSAALELIDEYPDPNPNPWFDLLRARAMVAKGMHSEALKLANTARPSPVSDGPGSELAELWALVDLSVGVTLSNAQLLSAGSAQLAQSADAELAMIARAGDVIGATFEAGSIDTAIAVLVRLLELNRASGHTHYEAITLLNLSLLERLRSNPRKAADYGLAAVRLLGVHDSRADLETAVIHAAQACSDLGEWDHAVKLIETIDMFQSSEPEIAAQLADIFVNYGDPSLGVRLIEIALAWAGQSVARTPFSYLCAARVRIAEGFWTQAMDLHAQVRHSAYSVGFRSQWLLIGGLLRALVSPDDPELERWLQDALQFTEDQQTQFPGASIRLVQSLVAGSPQLSQYVKAMVKIEDRAHLSICGELVVRRLGDMDEQALAVVQAEASLRPERWRWVTRHLLDDPKARPADMRRAAVILDAIGALEDIPRLRTLARRKSFGCPDAGRDLIRRLAPRAFVEDLGRLDVRVGDRVVPSAEIRRKVVSLLAFLLTRPQFTASREQVMEALWPEMDPLQGANSLNQTAYFLRRVFEPNCDDDTTAGYLRARGDLIWLDSDLVRSRSSECLGLIAAMRHDPSPELALKLAESYTGRFAVDFLYDDWSASYRDTLHASYLDRIEKAIQRDTAIGAFDRAITIAQHAIAADPDAEQIELALLRLYRLTGAHAAAAEQYAHYASVMREQFGVEPPPLESL